MNKIARTSLLILLVVSACGTPAHDEQGAGVATAEDARLIATKERVEVAIRELDMMRSSLAKGIGAETADSETFAQVCKPVGMRARGIGEENGWIVRQLAVKYRNPANKADPEAAELFARFEADAALDSLWLETHHEDVAGLRYLRRIKVESSCLACHGAKDDRPAFVVAGYTDDRAFDFKPGDLRGLYSVFVPDTSRAIISGP